MSIFKNQSTPISKLNMSNFEEFATDYAQYAFELAYKCIPKEENASLLAISALARCVCVEAAEPGSDQIGSELAIQKAMKAYLTKAQRDRLVNDSLRTDNNIFNWEIGEKIIDGAVKKANRDMPRYAPVFTGISGTMLILTLVALIIAAIVFIWINPLKSKISDDGSESSPDIIQSTPAARLNSQLLLDVESKVLTADRTGRAFKGAVPVMISVTGIDAQESLTVSVTGSDEKTYQVFQTETEKTSSNKSGSGSCYYFVADKNQIYNVEISNPGGASVMHYVSVYQLEKDFDGTIAPFCAIKCSGESVVYPFAGTQGIQAVSGSGSNGEAQPGSLNVNVHGSEVTTSYKVVYLEEDRSMNFTCPNEGVRTGVESIDVSVSNESGGRDNYVIPVIIADNVPVISPASRSISFKHTPSKAGTWSGRLSAVDADGDDIVYTLKDTSNCSVMMSPGGAYIVRAAEDFGGSEASFRVTASDGFIESNPIEITVKLTNGLVSADHYQFNRACMGQGSSNVIPLPQVDDDGDPITWSISSPENGQTEYAYVSIEKGSLVYKTIENINRDYTDSVMLFCTDGWTTGVPISFDISFQRNQPPVQSGESRYTMKRSEGSKTIDVELDNDNPSDVCEIIEVVSCPDGEIREEGWKDLKFSFTPNESASLCNVQLRVSENGGLNTAVVEYNIIVE